MWCMVYRNNLLLRSTNTNNYTEVTFRLLKDIALDRTKAFNLTQLIDFILRNFESYYKQRVLDLIMGRTTKSILNRYVTSSRNVNENEINQINNFEYYVHSSSNNTITYLVDMLTGKCTCPVGFNGKHCKHQAAVLLKYNLNFSINTLTLNTKCQLYEVASGQCANREMFLPLQCTTSDQNMDLITVENSHNKSNMESNEDFGDINSECIKNAPTSQEISDIKNEWKSYCTDILEKIDQDPVAFYPAVKRFLDNKNKYANSDNNLISGLYHCFKYSGVRSTRRQTNLRHGKKISVQPTTISRRKALLCGRRAQTAGRSTKRLSNTKTKTPHSLAKCVEENKGLGGNKFRK